MDAKEAILSRRSVRKFLERDISEDDINTLAEAAYNAPSACNKKPLEFFFVTNEDKLTALSESGRFTKMIAPLAIIVAGNMERTLPCSFAEYWIQDAAAATENILVMAKALGLGSCWNGVHLQPSLAEKIAKILGLSEHITPFSLIWVGYPAEFPESHTGYDAERVKFIR